MTKAVDPLVSKPGVKWKSNVLAKPIAAPVNDLYD
jgi:hypothetical protein